ncbi:D-mannose binding lectin (plasmid) [Paludisphaera borealis]|uniref:D-mannose binding lectin n=1 Tax=Paludisphaera borealis TaxID=1387353 RepID=A0A1U7CZI2_9BACT|nr:D-mannose binding lectin [Paludisphaera borealis]
MSDRLFAGESLGVGKALFSHNNKYAFVLQPDGNLVLYPNGSTHALWASGTSGEVYAAVLQQQDGNFVIYGPSGAVWASNTNGNQVAWLVMQDDGNVVIYRTDGIPIWATNTDNPGPLPMPGPSPAFCCTIVYGQDQGGGHLNQTIHEPNYAQAASTCENIRAQHGAAGYQVSSGNCP